MYRFILSVRKPVRWLIFWSYTALIAFLSLIPQAPPMQHDSDKLAHFAAYFAFALLAVFVVRSNVQFLVYCCLIVLYGGLLEFAQGLLSWRYMSAADALANSLGVVAGYIFAIRLVGKQGFARADGVH